ncbi:MAG: deoxyhypusine synthase [Candidatus Hadarchaeales archaeon]
MRKTPYFKEKMKTIEVKDKSISQLLSEMADTGFQGRKLGEAAKVWEEMIGEKDLTIIMGYAGSMSTTGMWKIVCWLIENRYVDILVSTGANISEDLLEAMGGTYWKGSPFVDDADLLKHKIDRFYDVYADELEYRQMERLIKEFMMTLEDRPYSSREFLYLFGNWLWKKGIKCIVSTAARKKVPIFCPAIVDSGYGIAAVEAQKEGKIVRIDQMEDFREFVKIGERAKRTGVVYIGGGVPKDFTQLLAVAIDLMRGGEVPYPHEYAIQITADSPQWGGLSGCTFQEAVSWGKISATGKNVVCYCDATIALPLVSHSLKERAKPRKSSPDFSWLFGE